MTCAEEDEYHVPLVDQRVFGAGIKRKRIAFVPASSDDSSQAKATNPSRARNKYLSIVMKDAIEEEDQVLVMERNENTDTEEVMPTCPICGQSITGQKADERGHQSSIAHQLCLDHSLPPSHLDRSHIGLKYMQEYGWNPDARRGLGARGEGIQIPIKAKQKNDSAGLGLLTKDDDEDAGPKSKKQQKPRDPPVIKLNAKKIRKIEAEKSRRAEKLRQSVYGEDLSQYLGPDG